MFYGEPNVDGVLTTVTCAHAGFTCLYAGVLHSFDFTSTGQLDRLVLLGAARAEFTGTPQTIPQFASIRGDKFIVWCRDVNTLNVDYITITNKTPLPATQAAAPAAVTKPAQSHGHGKRGP